MRVVTCEWKIERERVKGDVAAFYSIKNILAIDIVSRLNQMTKKFHSLNQNYLFKMNTLMDIYGVVPTFGTKKKNWDTWQKISSQLKSNFESKGQL